MKLLIGRHGNTFGPNDKVVWAGLKNDLKLVTSGREQALKLAKYLDQEKIDLTQIYTAGLSRTAEYGEIVNNSLKLNSKIIKRSELDELDYGLWTGLSNAEISYSYGTDELTAWNENGIFPKNADWNESEPEVKLRVLKLTQELIESHEDQDNILLISSNGIIRYFLCLIPDLFEQYQNNGMLKVQTGSLSIFELNKSTWSLLAWNLDLS
jgi:broad specificity phosphatase PhoE